MAVRRTAALGDALQAFDRAPAGRAERQQDGGQPFPRTPAFFDGQRLGERTHQHLSERDAHGLDALERRVVDGQQVRHDVPHHRSGDEHVDGDHRVLAPFLRRCACGCAGEHRRELDGGVEVADEQQVLEVVRHGRHQRAPFVVVLLEAQQVEQQRQIEGPQRARGHAVHPDDSRARADRRWPARRPPLACGRPTARARTPPTRTFRRSTTSAAFRRRGSTPLRTLRSGRTAPPRHRRGPG